MPDGSADRGVVLKGTAVPWGYLLYTVCCGSASSQIQMLGERVHRSWNLHRVTHVGLAVLSVNHPLGDFRQNIKQMMMMMMFSDDFDQGLV